MQLLYFLLLVLSFISGLFIVLYTFNKKIFIDKWLVLVSFLVLVHLILQTLYFKENLTLLFVGIVLFIIQTTISVKKYSQFTIKETGERIEIVKNLTTIMKNEVKRR